jgi:hypothetical protein
MGPFVFTNKRNESITVIVEALDEKTAWATMANVVGGCTSTWDLLPAPNGVYKELEDDRLREAFRRGDCTHTW